MERILLYSNEKVGNAPWVLALIALSLHGCSGFSRLGALDASADSSHADAASMDQKGRSPDALVANDLAANDLAANDLAANDLAANDLAANDLAASDLAVNDFAADASAADAVVRDIPIARSWNRVSSPYRTLRGFWGSAPNDVWAVGEQDIIYHFDGKDWKQSGLTSTDPQRHLSALIGFSSGHIWAVGTSVMLFDGTAWRVFAPPVSFGFSLEGVWGSAPNNVWAVGHSGPSGNALIVKNDGSLWTRHATTIQANLEDIWGSSANDIWAVGRAGGQGVILHFDGQSWRVAKTTPSELRAIWGRSANDVLVVGYGAMMRYDGKTWRSVSLPLYATLYDVWGCGSEIWAVGSEIHGKAVILRNAGQGWHIDSRSGSGEYSAVGGFDCQHVWASNSSALFRYE
jgi:hypothetical protein